MFGAYVYRKISENPHPLPGIDTAIEESTTGRVSLCTFSIQQTMCAYAKFLLLEK